jgi:hypothetical protein
MRNAVFRFQWHGLAELLALWPTGRSQPVSYCDPNGEWKMPLAGFGGLLIVLLCCRRVWSCRGPLLCQAEGEKRAAPVCIQPTHLGCREIRRVFAATTVPRSRNTSMGDPVIEWSALQTGTWAGHFPVLVDSRLECLLQRSQRGFALVDSVLSRRPEQFRCFRPLPCDKGLDLTVPPVPRVRNPGWQSPRRSPCGRGRLGRSQVSWAQYRQLSFRALTCGLLDLWSAVAVDDGLRPSEPSADLRIAYPPSVPSASDRRLI